MKFYQIRDPYYALIAAKSPEECRGVYEDVVSDIDDEELFFNTLETVEAEQALSIIANGMTEEGGTIGFDLAAGMIIDARKMTHGELLLVDGDLI